LTRIRTLAAVQVFGIEVDQSLARCWRGWLAPPAQPFYLDAGQAEAYGVTGSLPVPQLSAELRDTFAAWRVARGLNLIWLEEPVFYDLPRRVRARLVRAQVEHRRGLVPTVRQWSGSGPVDAAGLRGQADGHRFVWWPSMLKAADDSVTGLIISRNDALLPSQHTAVTATGWKAAGHALPRAEELAGTFACGSGPNCFGTVMAAAGVDGAAATWMLQEPFETWLRESTRAGGDDERPGTVIVWRDTAGTARHAAVTLGGGWGLHKPSQSWWTPRKVLAVRDIIRGNRTTGLRIHRYTLC
jgi:hypothetical protein